MNIFEQASRLKLRFSTNSHGVISVEDLWDLPLQTQKANGLSLDGVAILLNKQIKALGEESFVSDKPAGNAELALKMEIVKHVISVRKEENVARQAAAEKRALREKVMQVIAQKQDKELEEKSLDELQKLLED